LARGFASATRPSEGSHADQRVVADERTGHRLVEAGRERRVPGGASEPLGGRQPTGRTHRRDRGRDPVVAVQPRDLLGEVGRARRSPRQVGGRDHQPRVGRVDLAARTLEERTLRVVVEVVDAEQPAYPPGVEGDGGPLIAQAPAVAGDSAAVPTARAPASSTSRPAARAAARSAPTGIDAPFEPGARLADEPEPTGGRPDGPGPRPPPRPARARSWPHLGVEAAHHAGQADQPLGVGDHEVALEQGALDVVEGP
jgi:hypothetical protein